MASVSGISLYLSARKGNRTDYRLVLMVKSSINAYELPLALSSKQASEFDHDGWYYFPFETDVDLSVGEYIIVVYQAPNNYADSPDFNYNYIDWFHSSDIENLKNNDNDTQVFSFSNDAEFSTSSSYAVSYATGPLYGYGYGKGQTGSSLDYFNILGFSGDDLGYAYDESSSFYGYAYGFEQDEFIFEKTLERNFKIYEEFNKIEYTVDTGDDIDSEYLKITFPAAETEQTVFDNRQDFVFGTKTGTAVVGDYLSLKNVGQRIYSADITLFDSQENYFESPRVEWFESNLFLSTNDSNYTYIYNPSGNTNSSRVKLITAPYFSGVYYSDDGGSTWSDISSGLELADGSSRNISCVVISQDGTYALAFDNTSVSERGKIFSYNFSTQIWSLASSDIVGRVVNTITPTSTDGKFYIGTDSGIYVTVDNGVTWSANGGVSKNISKVKVFSSDPDIEDGTGSYLLYACDTGLYVELFGLVTHDLYEVGEVFTFDATDNGIYFSSSSGLLKSDSDWATLISTYQTLAVTSEISYSGENESDINFYSFGISNQRITGISHDPNNHSEMYLSQYGGVFVSKNAGGNFAVISNSLPERRVKQLLINPVKSRIIYVTVETVQFSRAGITFIVDTSGSMYENDPDGKRIDLAKALIDSVQAQADASNVDAYYQVVSFGISEENNSSFIEGQLSGGVINKTGGFTSSDTTAKTALENLRNEGRHYRSPLFEAGDLVAEAADAGGVNWIYNRRKGEYEYETVLSQFFSELDKVIILLTDGHNTVLSKTIENLTDKNSFFSNMRGVFYSIGIGHNINYEILKTLSDSHPSGQLYLAPFEENIFGSDPEFETISDVLIDREQFRVRKGNWKKIVHYDSPRRMVSIGFNANVPNSTTATLRVRSSFDKRNWSDWSGPFDPNSLDSISLFGKHFEINIELTSNFASYSPEVRSVTFNTLSPKESFAIQKEKNVADGDVIREMTFTSLDDTSLDRIDSDNLATEFGVVQSSSKNYDFYKKLHRDKRTVIGRKEFENLITKDGYFFTTERGAWPLDAEVSIFDTTNGILDITDAINEDLYTLVPSLGTVIFYNKVDNGTVYSIRISYRDDKYRIGLKATNYTGIDQEFKLYDYGLVYQEDRDSFLSRSSIPFVASQLGEGDTFGFATPAFVSVASTLSTVISLQYINKNEDFRGGTISALKGMIVDTGLGGKYYDQNFSISNIQNSNASDTGYVRVSGPRESIGAVTISDTFDGSINQQVNIESRGLSLGESVSVILGDNTQGGDGLPTWIAMENLLFEGEDRVLSELQTSFIFGTTSTTEPASVNDTPSTFIKPVIPSIEFGGINATRFVVLAPTTVSPGSSFSFSLIAVDSKGFVDREFLGDISISIDNPNFAILNSNTYSFTSLDAGVKKLGGIVNFGVSGVFRILVTIDGQNITSESNPIITNYDEEVVWGDLNVSTVFSDGRQDIEFVADYARNVSLLNFIGIADDLDYLSQDEYDYIRIKSAEETTGGLVVLPGFRYRTSSSNGERVFIYENTFETTDNINIPTNPQSIDSVEDQFDLITEYMENNNFNYISFPIHSAYENKIGLTGNQAEIFRDRSFDLSTYRNIIGYKSLNTVANERIRDFVLEREVGFEVYSSHGNTEFLDANNPVPYNNNNFVIGQSSSYMRYALRLGKKFGMLANSGEYSSRPGYYVGDVSKFLSSVPSIAHHNKGLTAVRTSTLSSNSIVETIKERKTYATTGARMFLDFSITGFRNGIQIEQKMGSLVTGIDLSGKSAANSIKLKVRVVGDGADITSLEIFKIQVDNEDESTDIFIEVDSNVLGRDTGTLTFEDTDVTFDEVESFEYCYYVRAQQSDGHILWSSPIWVNFGRTEGIRETSAAGNIVYGISPINLPSTTENVDKIGKINGIPFLATGTPPKDAFPVLHNDMLIDGGGNPNPDTRKTPYTGLYLSVGNKLPVIGGIRMAIDGDDFITYGTHYPKFVLDQASKSTDIDSNFTQNRLNPDPQTQYKTLNEPDRLIDRTKFYRRYLFGTMWQYFSSDYTGTFNLETNTVFNSGEFTDLVKDPFMLREGSAWRMVYSSYRGVYPEKSSNSIFNQVDISQRNLNGVDRDRIEEFAGLLENSATVLASLQTGANFRILYADNEQLSGRNFARKYVVPNFVSNSSKQIYYSSSPSILSTSSGYRIYFLGWIESDSEPSKAVMGIFYLDFEEFSEISTSSVKTAFLFSSDQEDYPNFYVSRKCDFNTGNFMTQEARIMQSQGWPSLHPAYSIPWTWMSVVQKDGEFFYATINYMNTLSNVSSGSSVNISGADNPGTLILYSPDGHNFYQYNRETENQALPIIDRRLFVTPFKINERWFVTYRDVGVFSNLSVNASDWEFKYNTFNWSVQFSDNLA